MTRKELIDQLIRFNPFAGRGYYEGMTDKQLREVLKRYEGALPAATA